MTEADRDTIYKRAGFGQRMGFGQRPALLVIDLNLGMTDPKSPMGSDLSTTVEATKQILTVAREKGIPIIYTTNKYEKGCWDAGIRLKKKANAHIYEEGTGYSEIDERVKPLSGEHLIIKKYSSPFFGTGLASFLVAKGVDTVIITGVSTSGCVRAGATDCVSSGFYTIVVREAVGDRSASAHAQNLFDIDQKIGDVVSLEEALNYLLRFPTSVP